MSHTTEDLAAQSNFAPGLKLTRAKLTRAKLTRVGLSDGLSGWSKLPSTIPPPAEPEDSNRPTLPAPAPVFSKTALRPSLAELFGELVPRRQFAR